MSKGPEFLTNGPEDMPEEMLLKFREHSPERFKKVMAKFKEMSPEERLELIAWSSFHLARMIHHIHSLVCIDAEPFEGDDDHPTVGGIQ